MTGVSSERGGVSNGKEENRRTVENLLDDPNSIANLPPMRLAESLKVLLKNSSATTREAVEAVLQGSLDASHLEQSLDKFQLRSTQTEYGVKYSFNLQAGQRIVDVYDSANLFYELLASEAQKELISTAVRKDGRYPRNALYMDLLAGRPVTEETTFSVIPILKGSTGRKRDKQFDQENGRITFVDSAELYCVPRPIVSAVASLKLVQSVIEGTLVVPGKGKGDALGGKVSRALGGTVVLSRHGLSPVIPVDIPDADPKIGCAGRLRP